MPYLAKDRGARIIEVNTEETPLTRTITDIFLQGSAGTILPKLVAILETMV
jgi:NAD-dependent deacetylase